MDQQEEQIEYLHLYVVLPRNFIEHGHKPRIDKIIRKIVGERFTSQQDRITLYCNSEEKDTVKLLQEYKDSFTKIRFKIWEPDFAKHKNKAYIKRNNKAILRATHILMVRDDQRNMTIDYLERELEDLQKCSILIHLNEGGEKHGEGK